jgi:hypothetical protein
LVDFYPQADLTRQQGAIKWDCWLVENSEQSGFKLVFRIYPLPPWTAMPQNGAALWNRVEKEALQIQALSLPASSSIHCRTGRIYF